MPSFFFRNTETVNDEKSLRGRGLLLDGMKRGPTEAEEIAAAVTEGRCLDGCEITFAELRTVWGVRDGSLRAAWGDASLLSVAKSAGKGGAFFVRSSRTTTSLCKSLTQSEAAFLSSSFGRAYADHMLSNTGSLLMRILGVYQTSSGAAFIIIGNALDFPVPLERVYDVKGSLVHRRVKSEDVKATRLDRNWIEERRCVVLSEERREELMEQIEKDASMLSHHDLMDYSLLVAFCPRDELLVSHSELREAAEQHPERAFLSGDGECVYLMAIIDFLQLYNSKKKFANAVKSIRHDESELSTVAPDFYASRFVRFVRSNVVDMSHNADALM